MVNVIHVLHVDDEPSFGDLVADFLERENEQFEVIQETSASDARERLGGDADVDCIVSDYDMPGKDGIEFLEAVRDEFPDLPFILFTGKGSEEVASEAISAGATDYLQKGSGTEQYELLANRVENAVEQYRSVKRAVNLERLRTLAAKVNQELVHAETRKEVEDSVCQTIVETEPYQFAWIGEVNTATSEIETRVTAGDGNGYLEEVTVPATTESDQGPGAEAVQERTVAVSQNMSDDSALAPWQKEALSRGFHSIASVPLAYSDELYGILVVYATEPDAFDDEEQALLAELADDIAHAIHARDVRENLVRNKRRFEAMFNDPNILVGLLETDGTVIDINQTAMEYIETEVEDVREQLFWETPWWEHDADIRDSVKDWVEQAANGEYVPFETDITRSDGGLATINGVFRPVQDEDGEIVSLIISDRDITERKDRERRFEAMFEDPNILVGLLEPDGTVLNINDTAMEYIDADLEAVTGTPFSTTPWWPEEMQSAIEETVEQAANGEYVEYEADLEKPDGTPYSVTGVIRPVTNDRDEVVSLLVSARDVTERVRREKTLDAILENTTTPLFMKNRDGEYILVNTGWKELFGLEGAEVHGQTDADLFPPAMADEVQKNDARVLETGEPVETEERIATEDGERVFLSSKVPVFDIGVESEPDEPVAVFGVANDITEQKQRAEELERIRDRMEFALEQTDAVIWERDLDTGEITTYPEPCPLLERRVETAEDLIETVHPDDREMVSDAIETVAETGEPTQVEYRTTDGVEAEWLEARIETVPEGGDSVAQLVGVTREITGRKQREQVLERQNQRFDELASAVSHDLQTPLSTARGRAELAIETGDTEQMEKSLTALERADQLREDLVNVLRTREIVGETESVELGEVARDVWTSVTASDEASLQIENSVMIDCDLSAVRRLLENLFSNSIEHGREDVTVRLGRIDDGFYVEDDGPGIPEDERDDVFTPGYSTKEAGSGVGMVSVREIILSHRWSISITESESGGARFEITDVKKSD